MSEKLNIYLDINNLTVVDDEFHYKYSYDDIIFMIASMDKAKQKLESNKEMLTSEVNNLTTRITETTSNLTMLNTIKTAIENQS